MRDRAIGDTIYLLFTTKAFATNIPTTLLGSPVVSAYENDSITQITAGITLGVDHDGVTGLNLLTIVATTGNGYEDKKEYSLVITTGTVDSVSVVGEVVGEFSIGKIASIVWDELLTGATRNIQNSSGKRLRVIQEAGSYEGGAVWTDTEDGSVGSTPFDNGTITKPCLLFSDAILVADDASLNLKRFQFSSDSSITLAATINNRALSGHGWTLALGGQDVAGCHFIDTEVTGIGTGEGVEFHQSEIGTTTLGTCELHNCSLSGTFTCGSAGQYHIHNCHAGDGGTDPIIDIGAAIGDSTILVHNWQGNIEFQNIGATGTDTVDIAGDGKLTINANCVGGTITIAGNWEIVGAAAYIAAGGTINYDDNTTNIAATKVKTDSLTFTKAGEVDSNVQSVNGVEIVGDGDTTPFNVP